MHPRAEILVWYDACARDLPWRVGPAARRRGVRPDPYRVWLSEVMLQQTTTGHAAPYFEAFTKRWPTIETLAAAPETEVMSAWAGLGYYARARNLIACASTVATLHDGVFPDTEVGLRVLPGFGTYTAAAVAAIAFGRPANVVDGNVERVMARLHAVETPLPAARPELRILAAKFVTDDRPGDWAQALMDLGATICRPRAPLCHICPAAAACAARATGAPETYPRKTAKTAGARRFGSAWVLVRGDEVALVRRPARGLLGGMLALPTDDWTVAPHPADPPVAAEWRSVGEIEHVFTHFPLTLHVLRAGVEHAPPNLAWNATHAALAALPTVFAKALRLALATTSPLLL